MSKLTPLHNYIVSPILALTLVGTPFSMAFAKSKGKKTNAVSQTALNLDFSSDANSTGQKEKSDLDAYLQSSLDSELSQAEIAPRSETQTPAAGETSSQLANETIALLESTDFTEELDETKSETFEVKTQPIKKKASTQNQAKALAIAKVKAAAPPVAPAVKVAATPAPVTLPAAQSVTSVSAAAPQKKKTQPIQLSLSVMRSNSLINFQDGTEMSTMDYSISGSYKLNSLYRISAGLDASQDLKDESNSDLAGSRMGISRKAIELNDLLSLTPSLSIRIPVTKDQLDRESLILGTGISGRFDVNSDYLFSEDFSLGATLSVSKNFHEYTTSTLGSVNTEYSSLQGIDIGYAITEELSISAGFSHTNRISYEGGMREGFEMSQEMAYQINEQLAAMVGHVNGGSVFKDDGETYNIQAYDENNSIVYGGMSLSF